MLTYKTKMILLIGGLFTVCCWTGYNYYINTPGGGSVLYNNITGGNIKWPYEGWESFSENDDWVKLDQSV